MKIYTRIFSGLFILPFLFIFNISLVFASDCSISSPQYLCLNYWAEYSSDGNSESTPVGSQYFPASYYFPVKGGATVKHTFKLYNSTEPNGAFNHKLTLASQPNGVNIVSQPLFSIHYQKSEYASIEYTAPMTLGTYELTIHILNENGKRVSSETGLTSRIKVTSLPTPPVIRGIFLDPKPVVNGSLSLEAQKALNSKVKTLGFERGEKYILNIPLSKKLNPSAYEIKLTYEIRTSSGYSPEKVLGTINSEIFYKKGGISRLSSTKHQYILQRAKNKGWKWTANLVSTDVIKYYEIYIAPSFPVGKFRINAVLINKATGAIIPSVVNEEIGVIFNAFEGSGDSIRHPTYALSSDQLSRYIVYDREKIFSQDPTDEWKLSPNDKVVFDQVMNFISESSLKVDDRRLAENIALHLQKKANEILLGCWSPLKTCPNYSGADYNAGLIKDPEVWNNQPGGAVKQ
jgi:hypothetical protein